MRKNSERSCRSNTAQHRTTRTRNTTIKLMPPGAIRSRCGNHVIISTLSRSGLNATKLGANKSGDRLLCWRPHPHATTEVAGDPPVMVGGRCRVRGGSVRRNAGGSPLGRREERSKIGYCVRDGSVRRGG